MLNDYTDQRILDVVIRLQVVWIGCSLTWTEGLSLKMTSYPTLHSLIIVKFIGLL